MLADVRAVKMIPEVRTGIAAGEGQPAGTNIVARYFPDSDRTYAVSR